MASSAEGEVAEVVILVEEGEEGDTPMEAEEEVDILVEAIVVDVMRPLIQVVDGEEGRVESSRTCLIALPPVST